MIRFLASFLLAALAAAWFYLKTALGPWAFLHAGLGFLSVAIFDLIRIQKPLGSHYVYLLGSFFRILLLGIYGVVHMFSGMSGSGPALLAFATALFACLFFGVAWEAGASIHSHRR